MAFFPSSSGFIINGGNFMSFNSETEDADLTATQVLGKSKRQDSDCDCFRRHRKRILDSESDGLMILKADDVELRRELISDGDNSYRIHAASHGGRLVAVKTFEGPRAMQDWKVNMTFSKKCLHPNVLKIVGISHESSKCHFIQYRGITSEQKMQWLIANALGTDLNTSVQLSMKAVKGIAAGLSYIESQKIPVMYAGTLINNQKWDNFDILTGYDNEPIIAFHLSSTEDGSVSQNSDIKTDSSGIKVLNRLCDQLFSGARSILYDDSPKREFDVYDSEGLPAATLEHEEGSSNLSGGEAISNRSNSMENPKSNRKPRREVWWLDLGATNHSLKSIGRCFEDRLNWSLLSSSNSLLRRIRSPKDDNLRRNLHQCPGYLREEITLTCDLSKSVIVSHAFPGLSERCSICHQLVQYTYSESFDHFAPVGGIDPFTEVKSSDAPSVTDELFQPSLPFNEDMQSMSMADQYQDIGVPGSHRMAQFQHNLGADFSSGQTLSSSASHMDAVNQQSQQQDTGVPGFQWIVDETRPAVSFPSRNHAQSSSTGSRSESSPTPEQQLPAQDSGERKINKNIDVDFRMDDLGLNFGSNMASVTNNSSSGTAYNDSRGTMEFEDTSTDDEFFAPPVIAPSLPPTDPNIDHITSLERSLCSDFMCCGTNHLDLHALLEHFQDDHTMVLAPNGTRPYPPEGLRGVPLHPITSSLHTTPSLSRSSSVLSSPNSASCPLTPSSPAPPSLSDLPSCLQGTFERRKSNIGVAPVYTPFSPSLPVDPAYPYPNSTEIDMPLYDFSLDFYPTYSVQPLASHFDDDEDMSIIKFVKRI